MTERRIQATEYLKDLLRAYGGRSIIVKITEEGEVMVMAKNFVRRQLTEVEILFPYNEVRKRNPRPINHGLDRDMLSVIFHEALIDFELAYLEDIESEDYDRFKELQGKIYAWAERKSEFLQSTFPQFTDDELVAFPEILEENEQRKEEIETEAIRKARELLKSYGVTEIKDQQQLNAVLWGLAFRHKQLSKSIRNAMIEIAANKVMVKKMLYANAKSFNTAIGNLCEQEPDSLKEKNEEIKKLKALIHEKDEALKEHNKKRQSQKVENKRNRKFTNKFVSALTNWYGRFLPQYDLTKEEDILEFVEWFASMDRRISNPLMKNLLKSISEPDLFIEKVEEYNKKWDSNHPVNSVEDSTQTL